MPHRTDWLLIALAHRQGRPLTPAQIQKAMFILGREMPRAVGDDFYHFEPYNYGPFDARVYHDLEAFVARGLVSIDGAGTRRTYAITPSGLQEAEAVRPRLDRHGVEYLGRVVDWVASLSFPALIRAIYARYPEMRVNSVFVD
jgi:uncharacterized protein